MNKKKEVIGIDVSKDTFDVYDGTRSAVFGNDSEGFSEFKTWMRSTEVYCVMEVTGVYHKLLAHCLHSLEATVSVVNPLIIKRYIQMKLHHNKTDKSDAKVIYKFGQDHPQKVWQPSSQYVENSRLIYICINQYNKQSTALKNKLHSLKSQGVIKGALVRSVNRTLKHLVKEKQALEKELEKLVKANDAETLTNLMSIPGLGKKTALLLIVSLDGFRDFESPKQVLSYLGLAPVEHSSGTSVRGQARISKRGNPLVRNYLFMCSFTASQKNEQCKQLYERIVNKGKSKKLALIAVCNKLIKQAFAVSKSQMPYDPNYRSKLPLAG
jgi:transposase